ncbi:MAG: hypothetical protein NTV66_05155 [Methylococcales bacterium]|nr:hypothetical protein [Methylococcales bacterium]
MAPDNLLRSLLCQHSPLLLRFVLLGFSAPRLAKEAGENSLVHILAQLFTDYMMHPLDIGAMSLVLPLTCGLTN